MARLAKALKAAPLEPLIVCHPDSIRVNNGQGLEVVIHSGSVEIVGGGRLFCIDTGTGSARKTRIKAA